MFGCAVEIWGQSLIHQKRETAAFSNAHLLEPEAQDQVVVLYGGKGNTKSSKSIFWVFFLSSSILLDDPDRLIQCPYDKHHQIRARRFPYHLVKCRMNHPEVEKLLATCPFNARHIVPKADLGDHISKCKDKRLIEQDIAHCSSGYQRDEMNVVSSRQEPPCDEDWEK
ncbi:UNVERIFIED_CONTAM: hypothetical protein H355_000044, partial [Colinus virginianus]